MKLFKIYNGNISSMQNTPCKIAIFTDGKNIKVFEKAFFINTLNRPNWHRNINFEKYKSLKLIEEKLVFLGCMEA